MKHIKIFESFTTKKYYHITPDYNIKGIKKNGIKLSYGNSGSGVYLTDEYEKSILWRDIKMDEDIEDGENKYKNVKDWYTIVVTNLDEDLLKKFDYYDTDFESISMVGGPKKEWLVDEYVYSQDILPKDIVEIIKTERYVPYEAH